MNAVNKCHIGDCRDSMRKLIADGVKVQTCVTSPPYFGLRDYGVDGQLGLEQTPQEYIDNMVEVFRLVRELLADDGTLWLNIGDSYAGSWGAQGRPQGKGQMSGRSVASARQIESHPRFKSNTGTIGKEWNCKPKDLIGIPWMLAFALRADGWYLRQEIIWSKKNCMPESVTDRCTKSHEQIFLLSKNQRYYFDQEAIKEPALTVGDTRHLRADKTSDARQSPSGRKENGKAQSETRNKRSVWEVATQPFSGAHFATFPPALIEPCILAGSRPGDIVFDPFLGSGTTGQVAQSLGRKWLGCELNPNYVELQDERTRQDGFALEATA